MVISSPDNKNPILVHASTVPHLSPIERMVLDELVEQKRACIIDAPTPGGSER